MKYIIIIGFAFLMSCGTSKKITYSKASKITYIKKPKALSEETIVTPVKKQYYYSVLIDRFKSKKEAGDLVNKFKKDFPLLPVKIRYETPNYKIYTGVYNSEKEADRAAQELRSKYSGAFSVRFKN
ncbi:MAG: SPOR domain-containing protein [Flavobacteriales bacterium]